MKKLLSIISILALSVLLTPAVAFATPVSWDKTGSVLSPLQSSWSDQVKVPYITATSTTASSTLLNTQVSQLQIGTLSGILRAISGFVTTTLVNLASDVTGTLPVANGGTGTSTAPTTGQVLVAQANGTYAPQATSTLGISSGSGGSGTVSTSSPVTVGYFPVWTSISGALAGISSIFQTGSSVGIGTTTPTHSLDVVSTSTTIAGTFEGNGGRAVAIGASSGSGAFIQGYTNNGVTSATDLKLEPGGGNLLVTGNIGIGDNSPTYPLSISISNSGSGVEKLMNTSASGYDSLDFFNSSGSQVGGFGYGNTGTGVYPNQVYFYSSGKDLVFGNSGGANDMVVSGSTGYLGLNATSPAARLDVRPTAVNAAVTPAAYFANPGSGTLTGASVLAGYNETAAATAGFSGYYNGAGMSLGLIAQGSELATLTQLGHFGIGTTSPYDALSVVGNEVVTGSVQWPSLATPAGSFLAVNPAGQVIATTTPSGGSGTVTSVALSVPTGLTVSGSPITTSGTLALSLTSGYNIPLTASTTNWNTAYNEAVSSWTTPLQYSAGTASILQAGTSQNGYLSSTDWNTFNNKGSGTVTSVGLSDTNGTLTIGSSPVTTSGTITATLNLAHANTWTGLQQFNNSTSTLLSATTEWLPPLATSAGAFLAVDQNGKIISTTTPSGGGGSGTVGSGLTGQFPYYAANGTTLTATSTLFLASSGNIGVGTTSPSKLLTVEGNQSGSIARFQRDTSTIAGGIYGVTDVVLNELGGTSDQTGPGETFGIMNSGGAENPLGGIAAVRSGADNTGTLEMWDYNAGVQDQSLVLAPNGVVAIGSTSPSSAANACGAYGFCVTNPLEAQEKWISGSTTASYVRGYFAARSNTSPYRVEMGTETNTPLWFYLNSTLSAGFTATGGLDIGYDYIGPDFADPGTGSEIIENRLGVGTTSPFTTLSVGGNAYIGGNLTATGTATLPALATSAGSFLAVNGVGQIIATTSPSGAVSSVSNSDSSLTISPTTGAVVASLNVAHTNSFTAVQNFNSSGPAVNISQYGWLSQNGALLAYASSTNGDTVFGLGAGGDATTTGNTNRENVAIGPEALGANANGTQNVAIGAGASTGKGALGSNTSGGNNVGIGSGSSFGSGTLSGNTTGGDNTAVGSGALTTETINYGNSAFGYSTLQALNSATTITADTAIGYFAGSHISTGLDNIIIGAATTSANSNVTTGSQNIIIGDNISAPSATANGQLNIQNIIFGTGNQGIGTTLSTGNIGIGSSSPFSTLSVDVASSTAGTPTTAAVGFAMRMLIGGTQYLVQSFDLWGHYMTSGPTPTVSGGTSSVSGNDNNGTITVTGTALTSVTLTFAHPWATAPDCTESDNSTALTADITSISTTQMVIGFSVGVNSGSVWYQCRGHK